MSSNTWHYIFIYIYIYTWKRNKANYAMLRYSSMCEVITFEESFKLMGCFFSFFLKVALILILEIVPRIWIKYDLIISLFNSAHRMISRNILCHCTNIDIMGSVYFLGIFLWYQNLLHENTTCQQPIWDLGVLDEGLLLFQWKTYFFSFNFIYIFLYFIF